MKTVYVIQTSDGVLHKDLRDALRHANDRYGNNLLRIAKRLRDCTRNMEMISEIESMVDGGDLAALLSLRSDIELESNEDGGSDA